MMRLTAAIRREGKLYVAQCLEFDVASQGHTVEESLANLREALELYFTEVPPPDDEALGPTIVATLDVDIPRSTP